MEDLARKLLFACALSVLAGVAVAKGPQDLHCDTTKCTYSEELGPDQTKEYRGHCRGKVMTRDNSKMTCYAVKGTTCTFVYYDGSYWTCTCTNWNPTERKNISVSLWCPAD